MASLIAGMGHVPSLDGDCARTEASSNSGLAGVSDGELYAHGAGARRSQAERSIHRRRMNGAFSVVSPADATMPLETSLMTLEAMESGVDLLRGSISAFVYSMPESVYGDILSRVDERVPTSSPIVLNLLKGRDDPIALKDEEYPPWLWNLLTPSTHSSSDAAENEGDLYGTPLPPQDPSCLLY